MYNFLQKNNMYTFTSIPTVTYTDSSLRFQSEAYLLLDVLWNVSLALGMLCASSTCLCPKRFPIKAWGSLTEVKNEGISHVFDLPQLELVSLVVGFAPH